MRAGGPLIAWLADPAGNVFSVIVTVPEPIAGAPSGVQSERMTTVVRLPVRGQWAWDVRGEGRAVRISAHVESGLVNLSVWRHDTCVGTVRLLPSEVANLVTGLSEGLAQMARDPQPEFRETSDVDARRLREMEQRLADLESRVATPGWRRAVPAFVGRARGTVRSWGTAAREGRP
jgi:hypothetical protein